LAYSFEDIDLYNYLASIEAAAYVPDSQLHFRDSDKRRQRKYKIYELAPIQMASESQFNASSKVRETDKGRRQKATRFSTDDSAHDMDDDLMTDEMRQQYAQIGNEYTSMIHLDYQRDDPFIDAMIQFLLNENMPTDKITWHNAFYGKPEISLLEITNYFTLQGLQTKISQNSASHPTTGHPQTIQINHYERNPRI
jgi:hypothetical protein